MSVLVLCFACFMKMYKNISDEDVFGSETSHEVIYIFNVSYDF